MDWMGDKTRKKVASHCRSHCQWLVTVSEWWIHKQDSSPPPMFFQCSIRFLYLVGTVTTLWLWFNHVTMRGWFGSNHISDLILLRKKECSVSVQFISIWKTGDRCGDLCGDRFPRCHRPWNILEIPILQAQKHQLVANWFCLSVKNNYVEPLLTSNC